MLHLFLMRSVFCSLLLQYGKNSGRTFIFQLRLGSKLVWRQHLAFKDGFAFFLFCKEKVFIFILINGLWCWIQIHAKLLHWILYCNVLFRVQQVLPCLLKNFERFNSAHVRFNSLYIPLAHGVVIFSVTVQYFFWLAITRHRDLILRDVSNFFNW